MWVDTFVEWLRYEEAIERCAHDNKAEKEAYYRLVYQTARDKRYLSTLHFRSLPFVFWVIQIMIKCVTQCLKLRRVMLVTLVRNNQLPPEILWVLHVPHLAVSDAFIVNNRGIFQSELLPEKAWYEIGQPSKEYRRNNFVTSLFNYNIDQLYNPYYKKYLK